MITYPLRFFNRFSHMQELVTAHQDGVLDATSSQALLIPICSICKSGIDVLRDENEKGEYRYRCIGCNTFVPWDTDIEQSAQTWANINTPTSDTN